MLNPRQEQILNFIRSYPHTYPPTVREIGDAVGLNSPSPVHRYLCLLEQKGTLRMSLTARGQLE